VLNQRTKHGGAKDYKFLVTHPMTFAKFINTQIIFVLILIVTPKNYFLKFARIRKLHYLFKNR
jgi:hypothetical protein